MNVYDAVAYLMLLMAFLTGWIFVIDRERRYWQHEAESYQKLYHNMITDKERNDGMGQKL